MYHLLISKIAPGKKPALHEPSVYCTRYAAFVDVLKQSEKNPDTAELLKVVHEAMARHDQAPSCHYASHEKRRSFEHVEDGVAGYFYFLVSMSSIDQPSECLVPARV